MHSPGTKRGAKGPWNIFNVALTLTMLSALLLIASRPAQAQTEAVLYNFCTQPNCSDGRLSSVQPHL